MSIFLFLFYTVYVVNNKDLLDLIGIIFCDRLMRKHSVPVVEIASES